MIWIVIFPAAVASGWLLGHGDVAANVRAAAGAAPVAGLLALLGVTLGLYGRDRIRLRRTYASPTLAFLGKRLMLGSLAAAATYALSPVGWTPDWLLFLAGGVAAGSALWLGNLPLRL